MDLLECEIRARESCEFMKCLSDVSESRDRGGTAKGTTDALFSGVRSVNCAFCGKNHYHDKCTTVTDVTERRRIVYEKKLCYRCLSSGPHKAQNCKSKSSCYRCRSNMHHTAICQKEERKKKDEADPKQTKEEETNTNLVNANTPVLLQTASAIISDTAEKKSCQIKILLDTGSQRTYLSEGIVKKLNLQPYSSREMTVRGFGDVEGKSSIFNEY